jgi:hypothetical protein
MYLLFFVCRLRVESRTKTPTIYLRYKAADGCKGVDFNEQLLNAFCFPLGPEAVQAKEVQASEVGRFLQRWGNGNAARHHAASCLCAGIHLHSHAQ